MRLVTIACAIVATASLARAADKYELADLHALEKQASWEELVNHLEDIAPSKRDAGWTALAERACASLLDSIKLDEQSAEQVLYAAKRMLQRYPVLKQSKAFMAKRAEVGLKAFGYSYGHYRHSASDDPWLDQIKEFVQADTVTADLPQRAAKAVQKNLVAYCAWPFWKMAVDKGARVCKDADFQKSILSAFQDDLWTKEISEVAQHRCWAELRVPLVAGLEKSNEEGYRKAACPVLKAKRIRSAKCDAP